MTDERVFELLREMRKEILDAVNERMASVVQFSPYTKSSASGEDDAVAGQRTDAEGDEKYDLQARRVWPFGIRSVPPSDVWAAWLRVGRDLSNGIAVGAESPRYGPSDLQDGETAIYNKVGGCIIKLDKDGNITITTPDGKTVSINGSDHPLPKWDTFEADLLDFMTNVEAGIAAIAAGGSLPVFADTVASMTTALGDGTYESTKAKNG